MTAQTSLAAAAERLVDAVTREHHARREGYWSGMFEQATALASMALELELIKSRRETAEKMGVTWPSVSTR